LFVEWLVTQLAKQIGFLDGQIKAILAGLNYPLYILPFGGMFVILSLHSYKWLETQKLSRRLGGLYRSNKIAQIERRSGVTIMKE
jgi:hypothetical protein